MWPKAALLSVSRPSGFGLQVAQCVIWALALPALFPSALLSSLCGCWETLQAGMYLNSSRRASLTLSFV